MARPTKESLIQELTEKGVEFDPTLPYNDLANLLKGGENTGSDKEENTNASLVEDNTLHGDVVGTSGVVQTNVIHNGETFKKGDTVTNDHHLFNDLVELGFLA